MQLMLLRTLVSIFSKCYVEFIYININTFVCEGYQSSRSGHHSLEDKFEGNWTGFWYLEDVSPLIQTAQPWRRKPLRYQKQKQHKKDSPLAFDLTLKNKYVCISI